MTNIHLRPIFGAFFLFLSLVSCWDKHESIYAEACGVEPTVDANAIPIKAYDAQGNLVDTLFAGNVFVPNIFTPDNDDNGTFMVFGGPGVNKIVFFKCVNSQGQVLFTAENFTPNDVGNGWQGHRPNGTTFVGLFQYELGVEFLDGSTKEYSGSACAYHCGDEGFPKDKLPNCFTPNRNNGYGAPDPSLPAFSNCF